MATFAFSLGWLFCGLRVRLSLVSADALQDRRRGLRCQLPKLDVAGSNPVSRSMFSAIYKEFKYPPYPPLSSRPLIY